MTRAELTAKLLDIKRENGWTWKHICAEIGGMSPVLIGGVPRSGESYAVQNSAVLLMKTRSSNASDIV